MGGTTSQGLRYPYLDEVVTSVQQRNLAEDLDTQLTTDNTALTAGLHRPSARATRSASLNAPGNTSVKTTWATEVYDTDTMINLGTNNDRMTVKTAGLWIFGFTLTPTNWGTTHIAWETQLLKNTVLASRKMWYGVLASSEPFSLTMSARVVCAVNDIIEAVFFRYGTGTGAVAAGTFWAALQAV